MSECRSIDTPYLVGLRLEHTNVNDERSVPLSKRNICERIKEECLNICRFL